MVKTILGDDPFATSAPAGGSDEQTKRKAKETPRKIAAKEEARPKTRRNVPAVKAAKPVAKTSIAAKAEARAAAKPAPTTEPAAQPTPAPPPVAEPVVAAAPPLPPAPAHVDVATAESARSDYGPPIDRSPLPERRSLLEEVRQLERRVRARVMAPPAANERRRVPLALVWKTWRRLAMHDRSEFVDEFGRDPQVSARIAPLLDFLYRTYFRVETEGLGHIPDQGRALIVANHSGTLPYDGAMIMHAVRSQHATHREVRPLVEDFVFHFPYLGTLVNRIGGVRACQENAARLLGSDQLVAVFPEGVKGIGKLFSQRYQLQRFGRGGFVKLALTSNAPIIPTAVVGAEEIHPMLTRMTWFARTLGLPYIPVTPTFPWLGPLGLIPLPAKWYIMFGEPMYLNVEYGMEGASDRILINKLAEQVRQRIQEMIDALLKRRRSIVRG